MRARGTNSARMRAHLIVPNLVVLGSVFAPEVIASLSSTHVLTTKWVDGERLASSAADDVPRLCGVALNAYLTMLLDTGTLHCDPHPGNLLRTPDGRLCTLDWGMVIKVPEDLQLSLLEFIANLSAENYEEVPNDLVKLSFVPADKIDELRASGLTFAISTMLKLASEGGGPKGAMQVSYCRPLAYARVPALACSRIDRVCVCVNIDVDIQRPCTAST